MSISDKTFPIERKTVHIRRMARKPTGRPAGRPRKTAQASNDLGMIGDCQALRDLRAEIRKYASATDINVFVTGETGVGKELVAQALHTARMGRCVANSCVTLTSARGAADLTGWTKGSFTGADVQNLGWVRSADKGTLFLDEISETPLSIQAILLRILQERAVTPLGANSAVTVDFRLVSASLKPLDVEVKEGRFREDLFHRIAQKVIRVPPLRDRGRDIILLARHFAGVPISAGAEALLMRHNWPGNVRELQTVARIARTEAGGGGITVRHVHKAIMDADPSSIVRRIRLAPMPRGISAAAKK